MRSRFCSNCRKWNPTSEWGYGCPSCGGEKPEIRSGMQIIGDIKPYISMIDGSEITSRSRHREHLRSHGCIEVGNDSSLKRPPKPLESPPGLKESIIRAVNKVEDKYRR